METSISTPKLPFAAPCISPAVGPAWTEQRGDYQIRFAQTAADIALVQSLRFQVFAREMGATVKGADVSLDIDELDEAVDHLIVTHQPSGDCVGTYRLATSEQVSAGPSASSGFYTRRIFEMDKLDPNIEDQGVELGRACIALNHRNRGVLQLLLRGIGHYLIEKGKRFLFGCGSIPLKDLGSVDATILELSREGWLDAALRVSPMPSYAIPPVSSRLSVCPEIPALLTAYGSLGARLAPSPAYDPDFETLDFFVLLDLERVNPRIYARYCGVR